MKLTPSAKASDVKREWLLVDATNMPLGRLSSTIAKILRGKHKACFTPHVDTGDNVIVINAEKVRLTGRKMDQLVFHWHTGHPGGIKSINARRELTGRFPERIIERSVKRMMPKESPLARAMLTKLHVYAGAEHPHAAQQPKAFDMAGVLAKKNAK
jgi:large subunit ribosomal protein L13